jgi:hypothetical protein
MALGSDSAGAILFRRNISALIESDKHVDVDRQCDPLGNSERRRY